MYEKLYSSKMGGDLYRLQRSRQTSDATPLNLAPALPQNAGPLEALPKKAEEKKGLAALLPQSVADIADSDDLLIIGIMLVLLSEKSNMDIVAVLAMILLR